MDMEGTEEIYAVYGKYPQDDGTVQRQALGRFMIVDNKLTILDDNIGMLKRMLIPGPLIGHNEEALRALRGSAYTEIVDEAKLNNGHYMDLHSKESGQGPISNAPPPMIENAPEIQNRPETIDTSANGEFEMQAPEPVFDYFRVGMTEAQIMEVSGDNVYLNGHLLTPQEVERVQYNIRNGLASLRYRKKA